MNDGIEQTGLTVIDILILVFIITVGIYGLRITLTGASIVSNENKTFDAVATTELSYYTENLVGADATFRLCILGGTQFKYIFVDSETQKVTAYVGDFDADEFTQLQSITDLSMKEFTQAQKVELSAYNLDMMRLDTAKMCDESTRYNTKFITQEYQVLDIGRTVNWTDFKYIAFVY